MKFCMPHWDALRDAIKARGLEHLVASSGEAAAEHAFRELKGTAGPEDFDPLMAAHNMILANALEAGGLAVMQPNDDGTERCPVCYLNVPNWIAFAADGAQRHAVGLGLAGAKGD